MNHYLDHRQLADEMDLYFLNEEVGAGLPIWLPRGECIRRELMAFIEKLEERFGYERVSSPIIGKSSLYQRSGHLQQFKENMFPEMRVDSEDVGVFLRPMNCPHHHLIFGRRPRSYKELPLRLAEFGQVFRYENSGSLCGLIRARSLCQNDAHIYLLKDQAPEEISRVLKMHLDVLAALGLDACRLRLSVHDPLMPDSFQGSREEWCHAEDLLRSSIEQLGVSCFEGPGEAAFYGPKIDFQMALGEGGSRVREESISSIQLDFNSGKNFDLAVVDNMGNKQHPWIIHRAPLGSFERVVGVLLEIHQGRLPAWLSPVQISILPVSEKFDQEAYKLEELIRSVARVLVLPSAKGSLGFRLRECHRSRSSYHIVYGEREAQEERLVLESREKKEIVPVAEILPWLRKSLVASKKSSLGAIASGFDE